MDKTTSPSVEIPTALPGFEYDEAREKLLLDATVEDSSGEDNEEEIAPGSESPKPRTRRWRVVRTLAAFATFMCILAIAVSWFFRIGWFAEQKAQPISRNPSKEGQTSPVTEDEKLKMALSLVGAPASASAADPNRPLALDENVQSIESPDPQAADATAPPAAGVVVSGQRMLASSPESYSLPSSKESSTGSTSPNGLRVVDGGNEARSLSESKTPDSDDARGRSLFFGISKRSPGENDTRKPEASEIAKAELPGAVPAVRIPFGTLLPVRLVGSIYTLRNSVGFVRMELTLPIEGNGYYYPGGTIIVGNVRGGESVRAFVNIVGLIDPVSGELVKFSGELLGRDGGSGIEGKRRNLTSQWARFFRGMKDTAASVLGSIGAIKSGGTVILSGPVRRGTESMSGDLSGAILKDDRENTFLEVAAGSNGYVLVTGLPESSATAAKKSTVEAGKE